MIGHLEWSADKIDPKGFGMPDMRNRIAKRLKTKPGSSTPPATQKPKTVEERLAALEARVTKLEKRNP